MSQRFKMLWFVLLFVIVYTTVVIALLKGTFEMTPSPTRTLILTHLPRSQIRAPNFTYVSKSNNTIQLQKVPQLKPNLTLQDRHKITPHITTTIMPWHKHYTSYLIILLVDR